MRSSKTSSEGIVLAKRNFGEADRILSIYSKDSGKVSVLAKGVRHTKSRKSGHLEIFNLVKYQSVRGHGMDLVTEAEVINDFKEIRSNLKKISLAYYFVEVIGKITHDEERNTDLFKLLEEMLQSLENTKGLLRLRQNFLYKLLVMLGYWPDGKKMDDPDIVLASVVEKQIASVRVGKRVLELE